MTKKILSLFSVIFLGFSGVGVCAPLINSVNSSTLQSGQSITISGDLFGTKSPAAPVLWANFENGNLTPSPLGQKTGWGAVQNAVATTSFPTTGNPSKYVAVGTYASGVTAVELGVDRPASGYYTALYQFAKRYYDFTITSNQKFWRLWSADDTKNFLASYAGTQGRCYVENTPDSLANSYQGTAPAKNQWHTEEFLWKYGTGNGTWDYIRNGVTQQHRTDVHDGSPADYTMVYLDNYCASVPPTGSKVYMDDVYVDNTFARVMIGDAATLATSTRKEIQIPTAWSAQSVTVSANKGSFAAGEKVFLFVIDAAGNASSGYPITIGSGGSTGPAAPGNLRVVSAQ